MTLPTAGIAHFLRSRARLSCVLSLGAISILGIAPAYALDGRVFRDHNRDGTFDVVSTVEMDLGIVGATVSVFNATTPGTACATTTTTAGGLYTIPAATINTSCGSPTQVRVEVTGFSDAIGSSSSTSSNLRFATPAATGVDVPLSGGSDFCAAYADGSETTLLSNPNIVTNRLVSGLIATPGANVATPTAVRFPYNSTGTTGGFTTLATHGDTATSDATGATWGIAHQASRGRTFFSAFQRRRSPFVPIGGQDGTGNIFYIENANTCTAAACVVASIDLDALSGSATTTGVSAHTTGSGCSGHEKPAFRCMRSQGWLAERVC
jgi:hypothetical protein